MIPTFCMIRLFDDGSNEKKSSKILVNWIIFPRTFWHEKFKTFLRLKPSMNDKIYFKTTKTTKRQVLNVCSTDHEFGFKSYIRVIWGYWGSKVKSDSESIHKPFHRCFSWNTFVGQMLRLISIVWLQLQKNRKEKVAFDTTKDILHFLS